MGTATLILGESGTGKSTSMRNINPEEAILIKPIGKPLPFKSKDWLAWDARAKKGTVVTTDKWDVIVAVIKRAHEYGKRIVIVDDFQYVMSNEFMRRSEEKSFDKFTEIPSFLIIENKAPIMPAPLYGADDPHRCSGNSISEVLENIKNNLDAFLALPPETKEERKYRRDIQLAEKQEKDRINETSIRPFRKSTYLIGYFDPQLRSTVDDDNDANLLFVKSEIIKLRREREIDAVLAREMWDEAENADDVKESCCCFGVGNKLLNLFGDDPWYADWPTVPNPKYQYLERIVNAVREGLEELDKLEAS